MTKQKNCEISFNVLIKVNLWKLSPCQEKHHVKTSGTDYTSLVYIYTDLHSNDPGSIIGMETLELEMWMVYKSWFFVLFGNYRNACLPMKLLNWRDFFK